MLIKYHSSPMNFFLVVFLIGLVINFILISTYLIKRTSSGKIHIVDILFPIFPSKYN
jgi:hypothetical protein